MKRNLVRQGLLAAAVVGVLGFGAIQAVATSLPAQEKQTVCRDILQCRQECGDFGGWFKIVNGELVCLCCG